MCGPIYIWIILSFSKFSGEGTNSPCICDQVAEICDGIMKDILFERILETKWTPCPQMQEQSLVCFRKTPSICTNIQMLHNRSHRKYNVLNVHQFRMT
ncbi:hypothetical protein C0J52_10994 [Blattella germanica]|nr:hypothetical protein C0J52_10994 [Blattella germanica]